MQLTQGEHLHSLSGAANSASQSSQVWIFISIFSWYLRLWSLWWYRLAKRPKLLLYPNNYGAKCETVNYLITRESSIRCSSGYPDVSLLRCSSSGGHRGVPKIATKQSPQRVLGLAQCALLIWKVSRRYPSDGYAVCGLLSVSRGSVRTFSLCRRTICSGFWCTNTTASPLGSALTIKALQRHFPHFMHITFLPLTTRGR